MTDLRTEAMKMALQALNMQTPLDQREFELRNAAIESLRQALAQPEQEPIAWMVYSLDGKSVCVTDHPEDFTATHKALPLYTTPPSLEAAVLAEREACAEVCENLIKYGEISETQKLYNKAYSYCIEDILARGEK